MAPELNAGIPSNSISTSIGAFVPYVLPHKAYHVLSTGPQTCPFCGHDTVEYVQTEWTGKQAACHCPECDTVYYWQLNKGKENKA